METSNFTAIAKQVAPIVDKTYLHVMGEPLLHPDFSEIISICANLNLPVEITTNGTLLRSNNAKCLLDRIVRQANISLQALEYPKSSEMFEQIIGFAKEVISCRPDLYLNFRLWNLSEPTAGFQEKSERIVRRIEEAFGVIIPNETNVKWQKSRKLTGRLYLHADTVFEWPDINSPVEATNKGYCHALKNQFAVLVDGTVVPCCLDRNAVMALGNCLNTPLSEVLTSPRANRIAQGFARKELVEALCQKCCYCRRFGN